MDEGDSDAVTVLRGVEGPDRGTEPADTTDLPLGAATIGRYVPVSLLGRGGMAVVYRAYDPELDRFVALKLVMPRPREGPTGLSPGERLVREARVMARLSHPHILKVHDVGTHGRRVFLAMDLVEGATLRKWLREQPRSWREIVAKLGAAGRALAAAHEVGLVHRDFKPDNVLIDGDGHVFVADFGLARLADAPEDSRDQARTGPPSEPGLLLSRQTRDGVAIGTPAYMAPEQHLAREVDARADQFSFCVALHEALHGSRPFRGKTVDELAANVVRGRVDPGSLRRGVPRWLQRIVLRGLQRDPARRFASMAALLRELEVRPRRRRRVVTLLAAAAPIVLGSAGGWAWQRSAAARLCPPAGEAAVLPAGHQAITDAYTRLGAASLAVPVLRRIAAYSQEISTARHEACVEARVHRTKSGPWRDRVDRCLDGRRAALSALAEELALAGPAAVARAPAALAELGSARACTTAPEEPVRTPAGEALARRIDRMRARAALGDTGSAAAEELLALEEARALDERALLARLSLAMAQRRAVDGDVDGERWFYDAICHADAGQADGTGAEAWVGLAQAVSEQAGRETEALDLAETAAAQLHRAGGEPVMLARLAIIEAELWDRRGAVDRAAAALESRTAAVPTPGLPELLQAQLHRAQARAWAGSGRSEEAASAAVRALALAEAAAGPDHPIVAPFLATMAEVLAAGGHVDEARHYAERAEQTHDFSRGTR